MPKLQDSALLYLLGFTQGWYRIYLVRASTNRAPFVFSFIIFGANKLLTKYYVISRVLDRCSHFLENVDRFGYR